MRGYPGMNFTAFFAAEVIIYDIDYEAVVLNPARMDVNNGFDAERLGLSGQEDDAALAESHGFSVRYALGDDLADLARDATRLLLLSGWEESRGAKAEFYTARAVDGIEVFELLPDGEIAWLPSDVDPFAGALPPPASDEVRVTSSTGGQKGRKLAQLGAVDPLALLELAKVAGWGAQKYDRYNYLRGFDWSLAHDAGQRHTLEFWSGQDRDPESGLLHAAHAAWQALCLVSFALRDIGNDDRPAAA